MFHRDSVFQLLIVMMEFTEAVMCENHTVLLHLVLLQAVLPLFRYTGALLLEQNILILVCPELLSCPATY